MVCRDLWYLGFHVLSCVVLVHFQIFAHGTSTLDIQLNAISYASILSDFYYDIFAPYSISFECQTSSTIHLVSLNIGGINMAKAPLKFTINVVVKENKCNKVSSTDIRSRKQEDLLPPQSRTI